MDENDCEKIYVHITRILDKHIILENERKAVINELLTIWFHKLQILNWQIKTSFAGLFVKCLSKQSHWMKSS